MARTKTPFRLDDLIEAATDVFIQEGFARARMSQVARRSRSATGTIYLYVESKEALFDLALRRALEDPAALNPDLPAATPTRDQLLTSFQRCLQAACHLPQLWVALDHREPTDLAGELEAILREIWHWLARYRRAVQMVRASASDWPGLSQRLEREFHADTLKRLAGYLQAKASTGQLGEFPSSKATAGFLLTTLSASALGLGLSGEVSDRVPGALDEDAAIQALLHGLLR
ncbi:MAG TPA: helix-turn-helix domain-containing protein [Gemmatimonadales bacterium]|nr:helix-turn-helix domain-containing protein [Gemmatimonadales bacterium]